MASHSAGGGGGNYHHANSSEVPGHQQYPGQTRVWTNFEMNTFLALICKGSLQKPLKELTDELNAALNPNGRGVNFTYDEVDYKRMKVEKENKGGLAFIARQSALTITRTQKQVFARCLDFDGTPREWATGRMARVLRQAENNKDGGTNDAPGAEANGHGMNGGGAQSLGNETVRGSGTRQLATGPSVQSEGSNIPRQLLGGLTNTTSSSSSSHTGFVRQPVHGRDTQDDHHYRNAPSPRHTYAGRQEADMAANGWPGGFHGMGSSQSSSAAAAAAASASQGNTTIPYHDYYDDYDAYEAAQQQAGGPPSSPSTGDGMTGGGGEESPRGADGAYDDGAPSPTATAITDNDEEEEEEDEDEDEDEDARGAYWSEPQEDDDDMFVPQPYCRPRRTRAAGPLRANRSSAAGITAAEPESPADPWVYEADEKPAEPSYIRNDPDALDPEGERETDDYM